MLPTNPDVLDQRAEKITELAVDCSVLCLHLEGYGIAVRHLLDTAAFDARFHADSLRDFAQRIRAFRAAGPPAPCRTCGGTYVEFVDGLTISWRHVCGTAYSAAQVLGR